MSVGYDKVEHDVLVIGAGGAGLRAAIEAASTGVSVGLVCKSLLGKAHTVMAEGGLAASLANVDERDNWKVHFADTMRGGQYINNHRMAQLHAQEAPERVRELEAWGALFDRTKEGRILQRNFGGHKFPRLAHVGDRTGLEMIRTLQDHGIHQGIDVHMEHTVVSLLKDGDRVIGALAYERERGRFKLFHASAVVLATGGIGRAFKVTSNSWEYTGDGHSLAYHAGADLIDMECVQFHPTGMIWPLSVQGILVTEGVRGEGGVLRNSEGKRFMFDDIPDNYKHQTADNEEEGWRYCCGDRDARRPPELLTRDHVARCIVREIREGRGTPHGGVYLDISWIKERLKDGAEHIKRKLPSMYHQFSKLANVDITAEAMEVGPTTHYMMGGIRVDAESQMSTVEGLFAAGECAAGLHGANRLGGNSLSDLLVFGKRAGEHAAAYAQSKGAGQLDETQIDALAKDALAPLEREQGEQPYAIQHELQDQMQNLVGISRQESEMQQALDVVSGLEERAKTASVPGNREYNPGWHTSVDLKHLLTVSRAITLAAIERKESRGGHFRDDYPDKDEAFAKVNTVIRQGTDGQMQIEQLPLAPIPDELQQIIDEEAK
ncbi:MAG: fumarate reductase/succinate dehydrogenase flavoprotein subunit [Gemmatimonadetes bacterium]|jgi:succinate dehydrogenase / fumarate reductase flavoprotein subunit|nr:fumarate reductase/succinate dehydrogenase flavoprotein subunit [Gemmatimonadota bacterium]MBT4611221.1 fumarate reductase/succinate dehydrogenase flavoprotein subunit [Gemmatimonadota bacterium]MBT5055480.1 fumarate reductase/succinate dehydrogenase flavoprotein subunit [Gemmatimonadota bacterium]MBT5143381.1 fumarate reductase/succinate dehydrogenase flavoprotein subunit [Gemmatimonadota bacterium]MBT5586685.1 fumarate reductase/succinate dehydrogenase flavoprotein subunit [Gemmatimonadota